MKVRILISSVCMLLALSGSRVLADSASPADFMGSGDDREPLFDGLGDIHHKVSTNAPFAQQFFDQGASFIYAFNLPEALGSFREAARRDPNLAMAYWGIALALGPNYNAPPDAEQGKKAFAAITKAKSLESNATESERGFIDALAKRYPANGLVDDAHAKAYADAMRDLARHYPDDADANTMFAESLMDLHPWMLWTRDGQPAPGTEEIVATLEATIAKHSKHSGANHYYIHAVEASKNPGRALPEADRLTKLAPGAGHLVHMPSHIYFRVGRYDDAAKANAHAIRVDRAYIRERGDKNDYAMMYYPHNIDFLWASYMMEGNQRESRKAARELAEAVPFEAAHGFPMAEELASPVILTEVRFAEWKDVLKTKAPPPDLAYSTVIWHYGRGMAFAAQGDSTGAASELAQLESSRAKIASGLIFETQPATRFAEIASLTLKGEQEIAAGKADAGLSDLKAAVAAQDALDYNEPPPWYAPVRQIYGVELLKAGRAQDAEQVFREDLAQYPENGWSLHGLVIALRARGNSQEADAVAARFKKAWAHADIRLSDPDEKTARR